MMDSKPEPRQYEVLFPHVRNIDGQTMMFEPMFSGVVTLPDDDDTKMAVEAGWLKPVLARPATT